MSDKKKNHCVCEVCHEPFRAKKKFKKLCPKHNVRNKNEKENIKGRKVEDKKLLEGKK